MTTMVITTAIVHERGIVEEIGTCTDTWLNIIGTARKMLEKVRDHGGVFSIHDAPNTNGGAGGMFRQWGVYGSAASRVVADNLGVPGKVEDLDDPRACLDSALTALSLLEAAPTEFAVTYVLPSGDTATIRVRAGWVN